MATKYSIIKIITILFFILFLTSEFLLTGLGKPIIENNITNMTNMTIVSESSLKRDFELPIPLFSTNSAWNRVATSTRILPESGQQILVTYRVLRGDTTDLVPKFGGQNWPFMYVNYDDYSMPIFLMGNTNHKVFIRDYYGNLGWTNPKIQIDKEGGPAIVPVSVGYIRPSGPQSIDADGHLILYNPNKYIEYDYWQTTDIRDSYGNSLGGGRIGTKILDAGMIDYFNVREMGSNPRTYYSARATGVPLLAGLILPEDVEKGAIRHALVFAIPGMRNTAPDPENPRYGIDYFYPASITQISHFNKNSHAIAAGQRIRLRQTIVNEYGKKINESKLTPITSMYLNALRTYGAYLVDGSGGFTFYAEDIHTAKLDMTNDQVNRLIGKPSGTPLPNKPKWQILIEKLNEELEHIPIAYGPWKEGQNPRTATINISNFDVIEPVDVIPPASITDLKNITYKPTYINWTWKDPSTYDFSKVMVYINGIYKGYIPKGKRYFFMSGLIPNTWYKISTHTVDMSGNVNKTWVNRSTMTAP